MSLKKAQKQLKKWRGEIDLVDQKLLKALAQRFKIVSKVGRLKFKHKMPIVQSQRLSEMLDKRQRQAVRFQLEAGLVSTLFDLIHEESVVHQEKIHKKLNEKNKGKANAKRNVVTRKLAPKKSRANSNLQRSNKVKRS
jgi:chorismate mutase